VVAALVVLAGLGLRAYVWSTALGEPDLDEATVGVQAEAFLDGDVAVFFPNQAYGGTLETGLVAVAFAVLGTSTFVLKLVPVALAVAATALTWRAARRVVPSRLGQWCVPALMWCWPASAVLFSTKERGFYGVALVLAAAIVLLVLRLDAEPTARDIVLVGLCLGLGWWTTPLSLLVAVPALAWLIARHPALVRATRPVALAALAAGLPWILHNVTHGFSSLEAPSGFGTSWADRTGDFLDKLPIVAGLETPWDPDRRLLPWSLALQAVVVVVVVVATLRTRRRAPGLLATILVGYGVLYGLNGLVAGVGGDPRYLYPLLPVLALSVGSLIPDPVPAASDHLVGAGIVVADEDRDLRMLLAVTAAAVGLTVWGLVGTRAVASAPDPDSFLSSDGIEGVTDLLEDRGVGTAITDVSGMQITFLSDRRVEASSFVVPRVPAVERGARADPTSTYVLDADLYGNADRLDAWLTARGVAAERHRIGRWRVFLLDQRVLPEDAGLLEAFGPVPPLPAERR